MEQHVLSSIVQLSDGSRELVFSRKPKRGANNNLIYSCHICGVPDLVGERTLYTHIAGKRHQNKMASGKIDADVFRSQMSGGDGTRAAGKYMLIKMQSIIIIKSYVPSTSVIIIVICHFG